MQTPDPQDELKSNVIQTLQSLVSLLGTIVEKLRSEILLFLVALLILVAVLFALRDQLATQVQLFFGFVAVLGVVAYVLLRFLPTFRQASESARETLYLRGNIFQGEQPVSGATVSVAGMAGRWATDSEGLFRIPLPPEEQHRRYELIVRYAGKTHTFSVSRRKTPLRLDFPTKQAAEESEEILPAKPTVESKGRLKLTEKSAAPDPWSFETTERITTIGRAPNSDVVLEDPKVSWHHGFIERITGKYRYHHTSETNPTVIRRHHRKFLLTRDRLSEIALQNHDRITIGGTKLVVEFDLAAGPPGYITTEKEDEPPNLGGSKALAARIQQRLRSDRALQDYARFEFLLGMRLLDRYEIFGVRQGGMGLVCFVEDVTTHQCYAVKTSLPPGSAELTEATRQKLVDEINVWLNIPPYKHIVRACFVEVIDEQPYLFMEYVDGGIFGSLREWIGHLSVGQAVDFAYQICLAMEFVNRESRVVHLDLKPENVLVSREGVAKVTDFGLAKVFRWTSGDFPRELAGSLPYMSPEQVRGQVVDERSDIFSFGVMFYEMLNGRLPYPFNTQGLTSTQWREQLEEFYSTIDFYGDYMGSGPWRKIENDTIPCKICDIVFGCVFPYSGNRWMSFRNLREAFEFEFSRFIRPDDSAIGEVVNLHQKALSLHRVGRLSEALAVFNQALKEDPMNAALWRDVALALVDAGMRTSAIRFVARAKELNPQVDTSDPKLMGLPDEPGRSGGTVNVH